MKEGGEKKDVLIEQEEKQFLRNPENTLVFKGGAEEKVPDQELEQAWPVR